MLVRRVGVVLVVDGSTTGVWVILLSPRERIGAAGARGDDDAAVPAHRHGTAEAG
ncbi:hypothetical protein GCM10027080_34640 [Pedococcus soli]